jgi:hypothetical protein
MSSLAKRTYRGSSQKGYGSKAIHQASMLLHSLTANAITSIILCFDVLQTKYGICMKGERAQNQAQIINPHAKLRTMYSTAVVAFILVLQRCL